LCFKESSILTHSLKNGLILKPKKKKTKRALIKRVELEDNNESDYHERWFLGNQESIKEYYRKYNRKVIISPKFLRMEWLKEEKPDEVRDLLKHQKPDQFMKLSRNTYPDLVTVLLTNMWYDDDTIYSQVKVEDMVINDEV